MSGEELAESLFFDGFKLNRRGLFRLAPTGKTIPIALGSRARDLLFLLAKHAGAVVSKDDLLAGVWPGIAVEGSQVKPLRDTALVRGNYHVGHALAGQQQGVAES